MLNTSETWRLGRRLGDGLWLACCVEDAIVQVPYIMRTTGYRPGSVCIWKEGTISAGYWVHRPGEEGGIAASTFEEAVEYRERLAKVGICGFLIRRSGTDRPIGRREGASLLSPYHNRAPN